MSHNPAYVATMAALDITIEQQRVMTHVLRGQPVLASDIDTLRQLAAKYVAALDAMAAR